MGSARALPQSNRWDAGMVRETVAVETFARSAISFISIQQYRGSKRLPRIVSQRIFSLHRNELRPPTRPVNANLGLASFGCREFPQ